MMENNFTKKFDSASISESANLNQLDKTVKELYKILSNYSGEINDLEEFNDNKKILLEYVEIIERLEKINKENCEALEKISNDSINFKRKRFYSIFSIGFTFSDSSINQGLGIKKFKNRLKNKIKKSFSQEFIMKLKRRKNILKIISLFFKLFSMKLSIKAFTAF